MIAGSRYGISDSLTGSQRREDEAMVDSRRVDPRSPRPAAFDPPHWQVRGLSDLLPQTLRHLVLGVD